MDGDDVEAGVAIERRSDHVVPVRTSPADPLSRARRRSRIGERR